MMRNGEGDQSLRNRLRTSKEFYPRRTCMIWGWKEEKYTWSNMHEDETFTKERLDKAVANPNWLDIYNELWVEVLLARTSDHKPLLVHVLKGRRRSWVKKPRL